MIPSTWKKLIGKDDSHDNTIVVFLRNTETRVVHMIHGIATLFVERLPIFFRAMLAWLHAKCVLSVRIMFRLARVIAVILAWLAIVFGALVLFPGFISGTWALLALMGSAWGLKRRLGARTPMGTVSSGALIEASVNGGASDRCAIEQSHTGAWH